MHPAGDLDMPLRELLRYAIAESDGGAPDVLMRLAGGPERVIALRSRIRCQGCNGGHHRMEMPRDSRAEVNKGLLPVGTVVAHKTGASGTDSGTTRATNDVGLATLPMDGI